PVAERYLAAHRTPWWYLGPVQDSPVVVTYMVRGVPVFAANPDRLAFLNVLHGVYPKLAFDAAETVRWVAWANAQGEAFAEASRTYAGGLHKYEPREMTAALVLPYG